MKSRRLLKEQKIIVEVRDPFCPMFGSYVEMSRERLRKLREQLKRK